MILPSLIVVVGIGCLLSHLLCFFFSHRFQALLSTIRSSTSDTASGRHMHQCPFLHLLLQLMHLFCKLPVGGYDLIHCIYLKYFPNALTVCHSVHSPCCHLLNELLPSLW